MESFNHQLLCYAPKRIHFSTKVFTMRMNLAVLDWVSLTTCQLIAVIIFIIHILKNENVDRPHTSEKKVPDLRRPDRRTPMKALVAKKFKFVENLWSAYVTRNRVDLRWVSCFEHCKHGPPTSLSLVNSSPLQVRLVC